MTATVSKWNLSILLISPKICPPTLRKWEAKQIPDGKIPTLTIHGNGRDFFYRDGCVSCCWMAGLMTHACPLSSDDTFAQMPSSLAAGKKIKCGVSKWDSNTWSASKGLANRESPANGNQDNCLLCAAFMVDLPAREWVPFIKVNLIAYLCGSAMQSLWLEGFYQQNNVGKGSWKCKAMVMLACLGMKCMQRDGVICLTIYFSIHLFICSASEQLLYCYTHQLALPHQNSLPSMNYSQAFLFLLQTISQAISAGSP